VGQNLTALSITLNLLPVLLPKPALGRVQTQLDVAQQLLEETSQQIRDVMSELRPPELDDYGLVAALRWYTGQLTNRTGIEVVIEADEQMPSLPGMWEISLFRIAQEALTNVVKHAQASQTVISLQTTPAQTQMRISDNGVGFDVHAISQPQHWGILNMRERVQLLGGELIIESTPGRGTCLTVQIRPVQTRTVQTKEEEELL
jgi:signal transduction histidine kinase